MPQCRIRQQTRWYPLLVATMVMLASSLMFAWLDHLQDAQFREEQRAKVVSRVAAVRAAVEKILHAHLGSIGAMEALLRTHAQISEDDFETVARMVRDDHPAVREIQLSPDAVVRHVYPHAAKEHSFGIDLLNLPPAQREVVLDTIRKRHMVLAGPVELVQGGKALIARKPVFMDGSFWGFVTIILDYPTLIEALGAQPEMASLDVALRQVDSEGRSGEVFHGNPDLFERAESVITSVTLPSPGQWKIAAAPRDGWMVARPRAELSGLLAVLLVLTLGGLAWLATARRLAMQHALATDYLTGVHNRHAFERRALVEIKRAERHATPLALMMFDLDHFKRINDTWGHAAGDTVLRQVACRLENTMRASDIVGRIGGEEFVAILPETAKKEAIVLAERLRAAIAGSPVRHHGHDLHVTASIGVVALNTDADDYEGLLNAADTALYRAKRRGRNRVCHSCDQPCLLARRLAVEDLAGTPLREN